MSESKLFRELLFMLHPHRIELILNYEIRRFLGRQKLRGSTRRLLFWNYRGGC